MVTSIGSFIVTPNGTVLESVSAIFGDFIGGVTLTGSLIAFGKLHTKSDGKPLLNSKPLNLPGKNYLNLLGLHLVGSVGGGDMPVCITVLNSYSGWALVAEGFLLQSKLLTIVGSLIGFSGAILTKIMCDAMNRDIFNVIFGGMNTVAPAKGKDDAAPKEHTETSIDAVAELVSNAK